MPAVRVGTATYLDVKLLNSGNFVFTLQAATEMPASLMADIEAIARSVEAQTATDTAPSGAARFSNGSTRPIAATGRTAIGSCPNPSFLWWP